MRRHVLLLNTKDKFMRYNLCQLFFAAKLPKWFGERPGKKPGDPDSPEDEEEGGADAPAEVI